MMLFASWPALNKNADIHICPSFEKCSKKDILSISALSPFVVSVSSLNAVPGNGPEITKAVTWPAEAQQSRLLPLNLPGLVE